MTTLPATSQARKPCRFCKLLGKTLRLRHVRPKAGDIIDTFAVEVIPSEMGGKGVELTKPDGTRYHVNLNGKHSTCDCKGFLQHGWHIDRATGETVACKHCMALLKLEAAHKLPAATFAPDDRPYSGCHRCGGSGYVRTTNSVTRCSCGGF